MRRLAIGASLGLAALLGSAPARAQHDDGGRVREGAFVHMELGPGFLSEWRGRWESAWGAATSVLVGGSAMPWLVVGGEITTGLFEHDYDTSAIGMIGPFGQAWLDPHQSLYVRASAGVAVVAEAHDLSALSHSGPRQEHAGVGLGLGFGMEGRVGSAWSVGPALQLLYGSVPYAYDCDHACEGGTEPRSRSLILTVLSLAATYQ